MIQKEITEKILRRSRLTTEDIWHLFNSTDIIALGCLAERVIRRGPQEVYFHEHRYLRTLLEKDGRILAPKTDQKDYFEKFLAQAQQLITPTTTEIRLMSINTKFIDLESLITIMSLLRDQFPNRSIRALSARHIIEYARLNGTTTAHILEVLHDGGLDYLEGRGLKSTTGKPFHGLNSQWLSIHKEAHKKGISSDAIFIYQMGETVEDRITQLENIRDLQDETAGFRSFIPLNQRLGQQGQRVPPNIVINDLKTIAIAKLFLDNIPYIRAPWGRLGIYLAQLALNFGANDLEGSLSNDNNSRVAGARPFRSMNRNEIRSLIEKAGRTPVERRGDFSPIESFENNAPRQPKNLVMLLKQAEQGDQLSNQKIEHIAKHGSLLQLANCSSTIKHQNMDPLQMGVMRPTIYLTTRDLMDKHLVSEREIQDDARIIIDLGTWQERAVNLREIQQVVSKYFKDRKSFSVTLKGIKGIWNLANVENLTLMRLAQHLKDMNVVCIESSSFEAEDDLTSSEIMNTHKTFHEVDLVTVGKLELAAPYHGRGTPLWQSYIDRIQLFNEIQATTHGILGVKIEGAKGAHISPVEYLKALALGRIFLRDIPNIISPISEFPLLNQPRHKDLNIHHNLTWKLGPLTAFFGSNDFDLIIDHDEEFNQFWTLLKSAGLRPFHRNNRYYPD